MGDDSLWIRILVIDIFKLRKSPPGSLHLSSEASAHAGSLPPSKGDFYLFPTQRVGELNHLSLKPLLF